MIRRKIALFRFFKIFTSGSFFLRFLLDLVISYFYLLLMAEQPVAGAQCGKFNLTASRKNKRKGKFKKSWKGKNVKRGIRGNGKKERIEGNKEKKKEKN